MEELKIEAKFIMDDGGDLNLVLDHDKGRTVMVTSKGGFKFIDARSSGALVDLLGDFLKSYEPKTMRQRIGLLPDPMKELLFKVCERGQIPLDDEAYYRRMKSYLEL